MPRKVHDGPAMGTAQRPAPEQPPEWEPRRLPESWWQTCQEREALAGRLLTTFTEPGRGSRPGPYAAARAGQVAGLAATSAR